MDPSRLSGLTTETDTEITRGGHMSGMSAMTDNTEIQRLSG